jgi:hypothetical protein
MCSPRIASHLTADCPMLLGEPLRPTAVTQNQLAVRGIRAGREHDRRPPGFHGPVGGLPNAPETGAPCQPSDPFSGRADSRVVRTRASLPPLARKKASRARLSGRKENPPRGLHRRLWAPSRCRVGPSPAVGSGILTRFPFGRGRDPPPALAGGAGVRRPLPKEEHAITRLLNGFYPMP